MNFTPIISNDSSFSSQQEVEAPFLKLWRYFSASQWVIFAVVIILGLLLRWIGLETRPVHHDESLHLMYGSYYFRDPLSRFYQYDPKLHGPLIYQLLVVIYQLFGESVWSGRALIAILSSVFLFIPLLFRQHLSPLIVLGVTSYVALSPTIVYYSRFIREDFIVFAGFFVSLYGAVLAKPNFGIPLVFVGIALQFGMKENAFVHLAMLLGYILYDALWHLVKKSSGKALNDSEQTSLLTHIKRKFFSHWIEFLIGVFLCVALYCAIYSAGGLYGKGILDGLYRESLKYWWGQHHQERISGPFLFPQYFLAWYEPLFCLGVIASILYIIKNTIFLVRLFSVSVLALALFIWFGLSDEAVIQSSIGRFFKFKDTRDAAGGLLLLVVAPLMTTAFLNRGEKHLALAAYGFFATLFTYSFLGEKVPWLTLYPLVTGLIYLSLLGEHLSSQPFWKTLKQYSSSIALLLTFAVIIIVGIIGNEGTKAGAVSTAVSLFRNLTFLGISGLVITSFVSAFFPPNQKFSPIYPSIIICGLLFFHLYLCLVINFSRSGESSELISQVHTTKEIDGIAYHVLNKAQNDVSGNNEYIQVYGEGTWPLVWYFRDAKNYRFIDSKPSFDSTFEYIFADETTELPTGVPYIKEIVPLRGWWVPVYADITPSRYLYYLITRRPWFGNPTGAQNISIFRRKHE
jgi:uncharacterized protein (TIGR03663 family)